MAFFDPKITEEIREQVDPVDLISGYVTLKRAGAVFKGLCPFHKEKTPSFTVNPDRRRYHCFGCHADGDVIGFIMQYEGFSFPESVEFLASRAGIPIRYESGKSSEDGRSESKQIRELYAAAARFYRNRLDAALQEQSEIGRYLEQRGISESTREAFLLGFVPAGWDNLLRHVRPDWRDDELLLKSALFGRSQQGTLYDQFRHRLMFPLLNLSGHVIAFGGRVVDPQDDSAKYINSPEHPLFIKGKNLFGLYQNRGGIREEGYALLVEGYMDLIMLHQFGFRNAVAGMGTALTPDQAMLLRRYTDNVVLLYDGDGAGRKAAVNAGEILIGAGFNARIAVLPEHDDPDSFVRSQSVDELRRLLGQGLDYFEYRFQEFRRQYPDPSPRRFAEFIRSLLEVLVKVDDPLEQHQLLQKISQVTRTDLNLLTERLRGIRRRDMVTEKVEPAQPLTLNKTGMEPAVRLLEVFLRNPEVRTMISRDEALEFLADTPIGRLLTELVNLHEEAGVNEDQVRQHFADSEELNWLLQAMNSEPKPNDLRDARDRLRKIKIETHTRELNLLMSRLGMISDEDEKDQLKEQIRQKTQQLNSVRLLQKK